MSNKRYHEGSNLVSKDLLTRLSVYFGTHQTRCRFIKSINNHSRKPGSIIAVVLLNILDVTEWARGIAIFKCKSSEWGIMTEKIGSPMQIIMNIAIIKFNNDRYLHQRI